MNRRRPLRAACAVAAIMLLQPIAAFADTVASLLGNFTINQYAELALDADRARVHYAVVFGQLPALRELHLADRNDDGVTTQQERDDYVERLAPDFATKLALRVDEVAVPLKTVRWTSSLPTEQGGFSMRLDVDYEAALPAAPIGQKRTLTFDNGNYPGRIGWRELSVRAEHGLAVFDTNGFSTSLTNGLTEAVQALPASGPLDERSVHLSCRQGTVPDGAVGIASRSIAVASERPPDPAGRPAAAQPTESGPWLQRKTTQLVELISTPTVAPDIAALALLAAVVLGALHAFSPGHGKTIVGAYLIGSRSTPRHAVFLGMTVTITHTLVVFAIGLATLFASRFIVPERLFPALSLLSGLLVLGMGVVLLMQRWRPARNAVAEYVVRRVETALRLREPIGGRTPKDRTFRTLPAASVRRFGISATSHAHGGHSHAAHHHGDGHLHSHGGGTMHSHMPPGADGETVSWRSLLALGVSGGLVPCPSAMVLLLAAVALNKTFYGLLMVVAFSVGLALTLIAVGMAFLYARKRFRRRARTSLWPEVLPALSAALITVVGMVLCYGALTSATAASATVANGFGT